MGLSKAEEKILGFMDKDLVWADITPEEIVYVWELAKELDIEIEADYATDIKEELFNKIKEIIFVMCDGILEEVEINNMEAQKETETVALVDEAEEVLVEENNNNYVATEVAEREENNMKQVTVEEKNMMDKAREYAEVVQDKVEEAADYIMYNMPAVKEAIKDVASMDNNELELWLRTNARKLYNTIKVKLMDGKEEMSKLRGIIPGADKASKKINNILDTFSGILDDENKNGWGKFKSIVGALISWLIRIIVRAAQIALKVAVVLVVGAVKISAVAIDSTISAVSILGKEVVKPAYASAKEAYDLHKERKAEKKVLKEAEEEWDEEYEDYVDDNFAQA